ncbi:MAG: hypothetical protein ACYC5M_07415 [Anaerolineae bacterium]
MQAQRVDADRQSAPKRRPAHKWLTGAVLFSVGLLALARQLLRSSQATMNFCRAIVPIPEMADLLFLPALGLVFLAWGIYARKPGLLIPGCILKGIGWGVYLTEWVFMGTDVEPKAGVIALALAASWVFVALLTGLFTDRTYWWALIPAVVLGVSGIGLHDGFAGLPKMLNLLSIGWPVVLVLAGVALIIIKRSRCRAAEQLEQGDLEN